MKRQIGILLIGYLVVAALLLQLGCKTNNDTNGEGMPDALITKAEIEADIDAHWQAYGYSAKPAKFIAISFDDGPCPVSNSGGTQALLAALEAAHVKATFFVIGANVRNNKDTARAIFAAGHELGNHSDGYSSLGSAETATITDSLKATSSAIKEITGRNPRLFRAPNLNHGSNLSAVCKKLGMALIDGSAHSDWNPVPSAEAIKNSVLANPQDGGIILLHDNNTSQGNTMAALPNIVAGLRAKGFWIMPVSELGVIKEKKLQAGSRYGDMR